jgi:benzoyl-CoA reductase/2-hydroxyglutaryl-CoA dehydratase subunit BcrC/BadD/HgdB
VVVLNISDTDLKSLPKSFRNLTKLKALVAMNLPWHAMDDEIVGQWSQLNSLSELLRQERRLGSFVDQQSFRIHRI